MFSQFGLNVRYWDSKWDLFLILEARLFIYSAANQRGLVTIQREESIRNSVIRIYYDQSVGYLSYLGPRPRPIERCLDSVFYKTEMKIWAAHIVLPKEQNFLSLWLNCDFSFICFSNFTFQFMIYVNFAKGA